MFKTDSYQVYDFSVDRQHPYPGLFPFREQDRDYFFGRERETRDLVELIENNVLTVVFGKSGIGKTSLLRAGLMPKLRDSYFLPFYLRINFGDPEKSPIQQLKESLGSQVEELDPDAAPFEDFTLWEYFFQVKILDGFVKPLLFFDQFEEIFTIGKNNLDNVNQFVTEIADLIENRVPVPVQEKLKKENKTIANRSKTPGFRVIFSLREDYLPQLEILYRYIPSVRSSRYRVSQMQGKDAVGAVLKPGKEIIKNREVAVEIIKKIPGAEGLGYKPFASITESWETRRIEPFLLSLFCYQVNEKRLEAKAGEISRELIEAINTKDIIKDYYEENINRFKPNVKTAIENLLLTEDGYRKLQDIDSFKAGYHVTAKDIERLVNKRIIRKETRNDIDYIELIHDVLTPILKESRDNRRQEEKREKELAEKRKKYGRIILAIICMAAVFLGLITLYAFQQKKYAFEQKAIADQERKKAVKESRVTKAYGLAAHSLNLLDKDPTLSFRLAESAYRTEKSNPAAYNALLHSYYHGEFYTRFQHNDQVKAAWFSPDGKTIFTATRDNKVNQWDLAGALISTANVDNIQPKTRDTSPDGQMSITAGGTDKTAQLKDLHDRVIKEFKGHKDDVNSAVFSPDGKYIVTASNDHTARLWSLMFTGNKPMVFFGHKSERSDFFVCFSREGSRILTANSERVLVWNSFDNHTPREVEAKPVWKPTAAFSPDGKYIAITGPDAKSIQLLDMEGHLVRELSGHETGANSVAFSPDSKKIIIACNDKTARLLELESSNSQVFKGHDGDVNTAVFSPGGNYIVTASWDKTARLWGLDGEVMEEFIEHDGGVNTAVFSKEGKYIVTASNDQTARSWDLKANRITIFEGHTGIVTSAMFSPDGRHIITASNDRTVRLWDINGTQVFKFNEFDDVIHTASFSPEGKYILIGSARGPAQLRLINPEEIIQTVNKQNIWQLDAKTRGKYNITD